LEILWSFGGDVFDEKGNLILNSPEGIEALKFMYDLIHTYKIAHLELPHMRRKSHVIFFKKDM
jgi:ABC-type glycerol-3-phosphate transport system substrate-binding protein